MTHDWDLFTRMMLAAWIRTFVPQDPLAAGVATQWAKVVGAGFAFGRYEDGAYRQAYRRVFGQPPKGARFEDFLSFYQVILLAGTLPSRLEDAFFSYLLQAPQGIYYLYDAAINRPPPVFQSRAACRYLGALEVLTAYRRQRQHLHFAVQWLCQHQRPDRSWDLGAVSREGVYQPLSDDWRHPDRRVADCTAWVEWVLEQLTH